MEAKWIRELFNFSRKERNGILVLLFVIFVLIVIGKLMPLFIPSVKYDFSQWDSEVKTYFAKKEIKATDNVPDQSIAFDPNEVGYDGLVNMGMPSAVASNWVRYIEKGGRFKNKEDVKKIFGMTSALYEKIDSFIVIRSVAIPTVNKRNAGYPVKGQNTETRKDTIAQRGYYKNEKKPIIIIELNSTDSLRLLEIKGIGPVFASRIIRYRNLLGGYYAVSQLKEVYGMKDENYSSVCQYFTVDPSAVKLINLNFSIIHDLGRHPYIGFKTAKKILRLRDEKGKFSSPDDLSSVFTPDSLKKLSPYLIFSF